MTRQSAATKASVQSRQIVVTILAAYAVQLLAMFHLTRETRQSFEVLDYVALPSCIGIWFAMCWGFVSPFVREIGPGEFVSSDARNAARQAHPFFGLGLITCWFGVATLPMLSWNSWLALMPALLMFSAGYQVVGFAMYLSALLATVEDDEPLGKRRHSRIWIWLDKMRLCWVELPQEQSPNRFECYRELSRLWRLLRISWASLFLASTVGAYLVGLLYSVSQRGPAPLPLELAVQGAAFNAIALALVIVLIFECQRCENLLWNLCKSRETKWSIDLRDIKPGERNRLRIAYALATVTGYTVALGTLCTICGLVIGLLTGENSYALQISLFVAPELLSALAFRKTARCLNRTWRNFSSIGEWELR